MDEAKMNTAKTVDVDLWLMDDTNPTDFSLLDDLVLVPEVEEAISSYFDEVLGKEDEAVQSAA